MALIDPAIRPCLLCNEPLPQTRRSDALYCSTKCGRKARRTRWEAKNPEKVKAKRERQNSDTPRRILSRIKSRAKIAGVPFNLDVSDIVIPIRCPILDIEIKSRVSGKVKGYNPECASVDRIDPSLGYVKGNVRVISGRANLLKSNASVEELTRVLADLKRIRDGKVHL